MRVCVRAPGNAQFSLSLSRDPTCLAAILARNCVSALAGALTFNEAESRPNHLAESLAHCRARRKPTKPFFPFKGNEAFSRHRSVVASIHGGASAHPNSKN